MGQFIKCNEINELYFKNHLQLGPDDVMSFPNVTGVDKVRYFLALCFHQLQKSVVLIHIKAQYLNNYEAI